MKRYKYNPETMNYDVREEPAVLNVIRIVVVVAVLAALSYAFIRVYADVLKWDLPKTAVLKAEKVSWESRIKVMNRQMDLYCATLSGIEERDNEVYRTIFGLDSVAVETLDSIGGMVGRMNLLERRAAARSVSLDSISTIASTAKDMISHVPSVPPIYPKKGTYRISSSFGMRVDPVYGGRSFHEGIDIASDRGNKVYCTADGVVETVDFKFNGYGNEIVVDHRFGYKTRYAHLNTIDVVEGMTVKRGMVIGTVGRSGKSTGPHLHYEVIYRQRRQNPYNFMDLDMSVEEFNAMVVKCREDNPQADSKLTTTEILRRRK